MTSTPSNEAPPDATRFPFANLLADLQRRGYGIGLREYRDMALLASKWQGVHRDTFRNALAALIARDENEVEGIREAFDQWADAEPPPQPPPRPRLWTWHIVAVVLLAVAAGVFFVLNRPKPPVKNVTPPPPVTTDTTATRPPEPVLPDPPVERTNELSWLAATSAGIAVLLVLAVREARRRQKDWARRYWRHVLANEPGPHHYQPNVRISAPPFPRSVAEEVASILGRTINADGLNSDELDVEESLRKTLRAGMAPQLVFHAPPLNVPEVVLRDMSWQMRPWEAKVDYFVRELRRQGVMLEEWFFAGDPLRVSRTRHGSTISLETLALSTSESSLMVLSSGQAVSARSFAVLNRALEVWKYRTWIHPAANPEYWRRELTAVDVAIWPMTRAGVHAAAVEISRRGDMNVPPKMPRVRSVTRGDVERIKQLLALAPAPSLELAQEMRRRFCPDVPEEVLLFLGAEGVFYGETISFPPEQLQQLLAASSRDPKREELVRRFLLEVLRESRPPEESAAYLRWQLDETIQLLKLDPKDSDARNTIRDLANGPLKEEVKDTARLHGVDISVRETPPKKLPAQPPESLGSRPPLWAWPRIGAAVLALVVIVPLTALIARSSEVREGAPIAHLRGAYTLRWDGERFWAGVAAPEAPRTVNLFRDGQPAFGLHLADKALSQVALSDPFYGAWYELRAPLPKGNLATSFPVWVPRKEPQTTALPKWPNDDVSRRVVEVIRRVMGIQDEITEGRSVADGAYRSRLFDEIDKEFGIQILRDTLLVDTTLTTGKLVDAVRAALAPDEETVVLTFVTSDRVPLAHVDYALWDTRVLRSVFGEGGSPITVTPGSYRVVVRNPNVTDRNVGMITVRPGQTVRQQFVLRVGPQWQHDELSRQVVSFIAKQLRVAEDMVFPDTDIERKFGANGEGFDRFRMGFLRNFGIASFSGELPRTAQQFVDFARRARRLPQWQHDDISRRVVAIIAKEMDVLQSEVTPSSPLVDENVLQAAVQEFGVEYRLLKPSRSMTPQQLVDNVRAEIAARTRPVAVQLTWITTTGQSLEGFEFEIFGGGRTYRGVAGKTVDVPPGEYKVTAINPPMPLGVQRIAIAAEEPYRREFKVEPPAAGEQTTAQLRSFKVAPRSGQVVSFAERADGTWTRADGSRIFALRVLAREAVVNGVKGIIIQQELMRSSSNSAIFVSPNERALLQALGEEDRQFFIPDITASRNVMTHIKSRETWELYGVITER